MKTLDYAFQSSRVLYQTVASFKSNQRTVRQLKEELEALNGALEALQEKVFENIPILPDAY